MDITVLISSSPIKSHPSTHIIDQCIESVRQRLPDSKIIIMQDGVRSEQESMRPAYEQYLAALQSKYRDLAIITSDEHKHQARMTAEGLELVNTPLVLYMEHDTGLMGDIPFEQMSQMILSGRANVVRLMFERHILDEHQYLMHGSDGDYTRTTQWSQRPHLAATAFYDKLLMGSFSRQNNTFIEDRVYGIFANAPLDVSRLWIYTPAGDMRRSFTTDGREGAPKWDDQLIY